MNKGYIYDAQQTLFGEDEYKIHMLTIGVNESVYYCIQDLKDSIMFVFDSKVLYIECSKHKDAYLIPSPYFGGNRKAQNDIKIKHERL